MKNPQLLKPKKRFYITFIQQYPKSWLVAPALEKILGEETPTTLTFMHQITALTTLPTSARISLFNVFWRYIVNNKLTDLPEVEKLLTLSFQILRESGHRKEVVNILYENVVNVLPYVQSQHMILCWTKEIAQLLP